MTTIRLFLLLFCVFIKPISGSNSAGSIGQACLLDEEKECLLDNSQCIEGICMCSSFYKYINGSCVTEQSKTLGKECRGGADCRGQGEFCSSFSRCMCLSTHVDVGSQCKPVIYPGQFGCEDSLQCNKGFPGAECDVSRICVCPHGMFVNQQTCVSSDHASSRNTIINELMLQNIIMADHRQINKSEVKGNYFRRRNHDNSNYQLSPDSPCTYDSQCSGYPLANCNNVCQCTRGTLNTGTTCIASSAALQSSVSCPAGQTYVKEAGVCMTVQQPGEPCQYSQQCSALETGAFCLKMRCECVYGMRMSSNGCTLVNKDCKERGHIFISELGECRQVIPPGQKGCSHNSQCSAAYPDATCFMQTCMCPPNLPVAADGTCGRKCGDGYVYSGVTGECLPEVAPGGTCLYSSQCQSTYGGMVCDQNTCRCPNGLIFDGSKCSTTCPAHRRFSENNACVEACSAGKIDVNGECLKKVSIGQACTASAQCTSGSFCQKGNCLCAPGFYVINDQCQAIEAEPNASCMNNEKCTKGSVCFNGRCSCPRNHELVNGYCQANRAAYSQAFNTALGNVRQMRMRFASHPKTPTNETNVESQLVPIGSSCVRIGVTCDGGSVCVAGICVCPLGRTPRNGFCIKHTTALPGTSCADGEECIENSNCNEESMKCECISQTQMVVGNRCVERLRSHPGYGCTFGEMCVGNSMCINGKCECANGKVEINKVCVDQTNARIGEPCGKGIICQGGSYCNTENGKCGCPKGQREINGECKQVVLAYPGESCTEMTSRCAGGSYCVRGRCECPFSMTLVDKKCVVQQTADPGEGCNENTSCSGFSVCKDNKCTCVNEMVVRDNVCVQRRKVNIGASCDKYDQCLGNSNCVEKHCQCAVGHVVSGNVCAPRKTVTPGYLCNPEDICTGQSVCIKGVCQCKPNYKQMHNICVKNTLGLEGNMCSTREDCSETLICDNGICSCSKGMFSVNSKCRSYISLGQTCTTDDKCASTDAICFENTCTCKPGLTIINGECQVPTTPSPPEPTTSEPEVLAQMKAGHIGHFCTYDNQCVVLNSHCARNVCMCKDGFRIFGSTQCIPRVAKAKSKPNKSSRLVNLGETCGKLEICQKGAVCVEETCKCPETFVENNGVCVKPNNATIRVIVPPLSSCLNGEICSGNSECVHGLCFCKEDYTLFHGKCQLLKKVETLRKVESETKRMLLTTPSTTSTSTSTTTTTMTKVTPIPATTTKPTTTTITTTTTQKSTTYPNPIRISMKLLPESMSTTPSTSTTTFKSPWFKLVNHGNPCDSTSFCTNCSVCISGFCACPEGLELLGERCVSHYDAQQCVASNQCPSGANCVRGECKCKPGLGLSRLGFCIPINYADPGTSCAHGERCRGESQCIDGFCVCNNPLLLKGNQCVRSPRVKRYINTKSHRKLLKFTPKKQAKLGEYCSRDDQCGIQRPCVKNVCKCPKNYVQSSNSCVPRMSVISTISLPGEACGFCVGGSTCQNGICRCPDGYYKQQDSCIRSEAKVGAPCGLTTGCSSGSQCISSYCQCPEQYDADHDECYPNDSIQMKRTKSMGGAKKLNRVVNANSINCPIGYDLVNGMCVNSESLSVIQLSEPGGACEDGRVLCTGNSVCASNICICPGGETVQNGTCISISSYAAPGEACSSNSTTCTGNSFCVDGVCKCTSNQGALNGVCTNIMNSLCGQTTCGNNQICVQNTCQCQNGYTLQTSSGNCVQVENTNQCGQCGANQVCIQDQCQCKTGFNRYCNDNNQCSCVQCGSNQIFAQNQCQCAPGYYAPEESCSPTFSMICNCVQAQQTSGCVSNQQCGQNQLCVQNQCQCQQGFSKSSCTNEKCNCIANCIGNGCSMNTQSTGLPGQTCSEATPCQNNAMCMNSYCVCPSNRVLSGNTCVQYLGDAMPGQSCQTAGIICKGGSTCYQNICQCSSGLTAQGGSCAPSMEVRFSIMPYMYTTISNMFDLYPGQSCNSNCAYQTCLQRCSGGSSCSNSICTCPQGTAVSNNICRPTLADNTIYGYTKTSRPGDGCDNTVVCTGGSTCVIGTCSCDMGYTPSSDRTSCVLIDRVGLKSRSYPKSFCTFDKDCKDGAICIDKRCSCRIDEEMINGKCQPANQPGSRCHTDFCNNGAECQNGYCVCTKTHHANSTLHCVKESNQAYPGSSCQKTNKDCQYGSVCLFGYCVYPSDDKDHELNPETSKNPAPPVRRPAGLTECPADGSCKLPDCFCTPSGKVPPNNMEIKKVPQMVVLTFDDPITDRIINTLKSLFSGRIRNPNGCAIKGTFYISHQWNNYDQSQWLYSKGNEIGVNSITREDLSERTKERWLREQKGMRDTLSEFSYIEKSQIIGTRAPSYRVGGDLQFEMLAENNFTFDNSMLVNGLYWPQTLEHKLSWECDGKCPQRSHKNVWEIPIQKIQANDGNWYPTLVRALKPSDSRVSVKQILMRNFLNNYKSNRAPFVLTLSTDFLTYLPDNGAISALEDFLKEVVQKNDVYITTGGQVIDWMRKPTPVDSLKSLRSWQCSFLMNDQVQPCESPSTCTFNSRSRGQPAHSFRICGSCPRNSPWVQ